VLLRSRRSRHTSSEVDARSFCDVEFQDRASERLQRKVSAYRIDAGQVVQCQTEHFATAGLRPANSAGFDLEGLPGRAVHAPIPEGPFRFRREAHHDVEFATDEEVQAMAERLFADLPARTHEVTKARMREYVRTATERGDPEWKAFLEAPGTIPSWRTLAG
jgi:hypothetical protein